MLRERCVSKLRWFCRDGAKVVNYALTSSDMAREHETIKFKVTPGEEWGNAIVTEGEKNRSADGQPTVDVPTISLEGLKVRFWA